MFAYVVACYFGPRRVHCAPYVENPYYYVQKHFEFLKSHKIPNLDLVLLMLNSTLDSDLNKVKEMFSTVDYKVEIYCRPNIDGSYGAWHDGVINLINAHPEIKYALLIEDDYIPCDENVLDDFHQAMDDNTFYVCQFYTNHAAMSNGMIDLTKAKDIYSRAGRVFMLNGGSDYRFLDSNQGTFLNLVRFKYKVIGLNDKFLHPFSTREGSVIVYGNGDRPVLTPIL